MQILLLGATGRTGSLVLETLLSHNHTVTALVRNPASLAPAPNLTIIQGTSSSLPDFPSSHFDAVIITLATEALPTLAIQTLLSQGVKRLVVMNSFGSGESWGNMALLLKGVFKWTSMAKPLAEHNAVEKLLREEAGDGVEWTLIKPPMLKDGEAKPVREFGEKGKGIGMFDSATRASVAETLVEAVEKGKWIREAVVIAN